MWVLAVWGLGSVVFAWAWGRAATALRRPTPAASQLELIALIDQLLVASAEARILDDDAAVAAWLDGGDR